MAAPTAESFLIAYPEFAPLHLAAAALVDAVLARADRRITSEWPEETREDIVMLQAADMLARTPMGRNAQLSEPGAPTAWGEELKIRKMGFACARSRVV